MGVRLLLLFWLALGSAAGQQQDAAPAAIEATVLPIGIAHRWTIRSTDGELRPKPSDARTSPLQLVVEPGGAAGSWNVEVLGFVPGQFDVAQFLEHADGTAITDLPAMPVRFVSLLPPGLHLDLQTTSRSRMDLAARPTWLWPLLGGLWLLVPAGWLLWRWRKRRAEARPSPEPQAAPATDPLDDLVSVLGQRSLTTAEKGRLELLVLHRLGTRLASAGPRDANGNPYLAARGDPAMAPIVDALEVWLHHPHPPEKADRRLLELLAELPRETRDALVVEVGA